VALGVTTILQSALGIVLVFVLCIPAYLLRIETEERVLTAAFGASYCSYRDSTWGLIPGVR
jgi:protein-S-isoprenylcysteine O-methyltransferase Ste14